MGRELRRKEQKKNKNKIENTPPSSELSFNGLTLLKIIGAIAVILFIAYYFVAVFVTKEVDVSSQKESTTSQSTSQSVQNQILAQRTFEQAEEEYYVYFYDFSNEPKSIASILGTKTEMKIYRVDTSSGLNQKYITEESGNANVTGIDDLKVSSPTLIKISADKVVLYLEGETNIVTYLNQ